MAPEALTDTAHWAAYWRSRKAERVPERWYYADLLRTMVGGRGYSSLLELGGFPGLFGVYARRYLGFTDIALLDTFVDHDHLADVLKENGLRASDIASCCAKPMEVLPAVTCESCSTCAQGQLGHTWCGVCGEKAAVRGHVAAPALQEQAALRIYALLDENVAVILQVRGDAFLSRVLDNGDDFDRLDLLVSGVLLRTQSLKELS